MSTVDFPVRWAATRRFFDHGLGVQRSVNIYQTAADSARTKGIIIADTKFEFGLDANDELVLIRTSNTALRDH